MRPACVYAWLPELQLGFLTLLCELCPRPLPAMHHKQVGSTANGGVPVAEMDQAYYTSTLALTDKLLAYAAFADPVDPARLQVCCVGTLRSGDVDCL